MRRGTKAAARSKAHLIESINGGEWRPLIKELTSDSFGIWRVLFHGGDVVGS